MDPNEQIRNQEMTILRQNAKIAKQQKSIAELKRLNERQQTTIGRLIERLGPKEEAGRVFKD